MLKFLVLEDGRPAAHWPLRNAHLLGSDHSAMRAEISFQDGAIYCQKREVGAACLALQFPVGECGELTLQTTLLPERDEPYLLALELARHRMMLIYGKLEDWGMFDLGDDHPVTRRIERARKQFIETLCQQHDPPQAEKLARECLTTAVDASEELALAHAELLLARRKSVGALPKTAIGSGVDLDQTQERLRAGLVANLDFVALPTPWKLLAPAEGEYRWGPMDNWVEWAGRSRVPVVAGPVVSFEPTVLPDWIYIWEHDYDTVRDLLYEHTERVVTRYKSTVATWIAVSGLHVNSHFPFSFDQLMELTRMCALLVKKIHPAGKVLVELRQPFGEYYGSNQRSIPPLMYADLLIQGAVNFDGFAIKLLMGQAQPGQYARDLMQISNLLDQFAGFAKPVHLAIAAPSEAVDELMIAAPDANHPIDFNCGFWRKPWSPLVQSRWLEALLYIALSKPFVESVTWREIADHPRIELPLSGLIGEDLQPKTAFRRLVTFRRMLQTRAGAPPAAATAPVPGAPPKAG